MPKIPFPADGFSIDLPDGLVLEVRRAPVVVDPPPPPPPSGHRRPAPANGTGLFVDGAKIYDGAGVPFVMKGVNTSLAWGHQDNAIKALAEIAETGANTVRLVFDAAFPFYADRLDAVLAECARLNLVAVVGAWMATGKDDIGALVACTDFWLAPSRLAALKKWERNTVLNIANEWTGVTAQGFDGARWRSSYAVEVGRLRAAGFDGLVMIDAGGYGQFPRGIRDFGATLLDSDPQRNLVFSLHAYSFWRSVENTADVGRWNDFRSGSPWSLDVEVKAIVDKGLPLVMGEIGAGGPQVRYTSSTALRVLDDLGVGWIAWSWSSNSDNSLDIVPNGGYRFDGVDSVVPAARVFFDPAIGLPSARRASAPER